MLSINALSLSILPSLLTLQNKRIFRQNCAEQKFVFCFCSDNTVTTYEQICAVCLYCYDNDRSIMFNKLCGNYDQLFFFLFIFLLLSLLLDMTCKTPLNICYLCYFLLIYSVIFKAWKLSKRAIYWHFIYWILYFINMLLGFTMIWNKSSANIMLLCVCTFLFEFKQIVSEDCTLLDKA